MLSTIAGKRIQNAGRNYVVFDLETTGTSCRNDEVIEISAIKVLDGVVEAEFTSLVNPRCHIPYWASQVNGIRDEMVMDAPSFEEVLPRFLEFVGDLILVGHNIHNFDMKFLYRFCIGYYGKTLSNDYVDTLTLARQCLPWLSHHRLVDLAEYYSIPTKGAHRALHDCRMNQQVYESLIKESRKSSIKKCPDCGMLMKQRKGKYGLFWGCTGYPNCRHTENVQ